MTNRDYEAYFSPKSSEKTKKNVLKSKKRDRFVVKTKKVFGTNGNKQAEK